MSVKEITDRQGRNFQVTTYDGHTMFRMVEEKLLPLGLAARLKELKNLTIRDDDVMICTFPKAGTHWIWEIVSMVMKGKAEYETNTKTASMIDFIPIDVLGSLPSPRILNSHFGIWALPEQVKSKRIKIIHLLRNPKDIAVSFYYHGLAHSWLFGAHLPYTTFSEYLPFITGEYGIYSYVSMFRYLKAMEAFTQKTPDLVLNIYFEDMLKDLPAAVSKVAEFLKIHLSRDTIQDIAEKCSFENLKAADEALKTRTDVVTSGLTENETKQRKNIGRSWVFRKGTIGDWKNHFTVAENEQFDEILDREFRDSNLKFTYTNSG